GLCGGRAAAARPAGERVDRGCGTRDPSTHQRRAGGDGLPRENPARLRVGGEVDEYLGIVRHGAGRDGDAGTPEEVHALGGHPAVADEADARGEQPELPPSADVGQQDLPAPAVDLRVAEHHSMTFFSIGSTVTPRSRSQAIPCSIASSVPSSSMAMIPISSLTLACRMLNTRSKVRLR